MSLYSRFAFLCMCLSLVALQVSSCSQNPLDEPAQETTPTESTKAEPVAETLPDASITIEDSGPAEEAATEPQPEPTQEAEPISEQPPEDTPTEPTAPEKAPKDSVDPTGADAEACKLFTAGPFKSLPLVSDPLQAKEVYQDHVGYQMKLKKGEFSFFKFNAFTKRDHTFYFNQPVPFQAQEKDGTVIPTKQVIDTIKLCKEVKKKYIVNLPNISYYYFKVGPADQDMTVSIHAYDGHKH